MKITALSLVVGAAFLLPASGAMAATSDGVKCPSGTQSQFSNNVLKCIKTEHKVSGQMCPVLYPTIQVRNNRADRCLALRIPVATTRLTSRDFVYSFPAKAPFGNHNGYRRVIDGGPGVADNFRKTERKYVHPQGAIYLHNPSIGVKCESGFRTSFDNGRLKCKQTRVKLSACVFPYSLDVERNRDDCLLGGGRYKTVPKGLVSRIGWTLDIDGGRGVRDVWKKSNFNYPKKAR